MLDDYKNQNLILLNKIKNLEQNNLSLYDINEDLKQKINKLIQDIKG